MLSQSLSQGADPAPIEINAWTSLGFKGTGLNPLLHALEFVLWCDRIMPPQPHNYYHCCNKCASQRIFFPKKYSEIFQHFMRFLIINCQKNMTKIDGALKQISKPLQVKSCK